MEQITHRLTDMLAAAGRAFTNTSFDPEGRGARTLAEFEQELNSDLNWFEQAAAAGEKSDRLPAIIERYITNYRRYLAAWLGSEANCASSFIVGPSNFPAARMQKRNTWAQNHYNHFRDWRRRACKAIEKGLKKDVTPAHELAAAERKLNAWLQRQATMKAANKEIRKYKDAKERPPQLVEALKALGLDGKELHRILQGNYCGRPGFEQWELSNLNANIHRLQERVTYLKQKAENNTGRLIQEYAGFQVIENRELDRVQFVFPGPPSVEIRALLRSKSFLNSRKNNANQRKLTPAALFDAAQLAPKIAALLSPAA